MLQGEPASELQPGAEPRALNSQAQPSGPQGACPQGCGVGVLGRGGRLEGTTQPGEANPTILHKAWALGFISYNHHPPPHNHKTNFPCCSSKAEMKETVVVANEYFAKSCCPKPSALENSNEDQMESSPLLHFALLIKEKTAEPLNASYKNL